MSYSDTPVPTLTEAQKASLKATLHFMELARQHEELKRDYNEKANAFLLNLYESGDAMTLKVIAQLIGKSSTAVDKRLKQARD